MSRNWNTAVDGSPFGDETKRKVWEEARPAAGIAPILTGTDARRDVCGALIYWDEYGTTTEHGWEIDHIKPKAKGGTDVLDNLQPLHWRNNRSKGDDYPPGSFCVVSS